MHEGSGAYRDAIDFLKRQKSVHPLKSSQLLNKSAHEDAISLDKDSPAMQTPLRTRLKSLCIPEGFVGQNIAFGEKESAIELVKSLVIDDGVSTRIHRQNLFREEFYEVGICIAAHS